MYECTYKLVPKNKLYYALSEFNLFAIKDLSSHSFENTINKALDTRIRNCIIPPSQRIGPWLMCQCVYHWIYIDLSLSKRGLHSQLFQCFSFIFVIQFDFFIVDSRDKENESCRVKNILLIQFSNYCFCNIFSVISMIYKCLFILLPARGKFRSGNYFVLVFVIRNIPFYIFSPIRYLISQSDPLSIN